MFVTTDTASGRSQMQAFCDTTSQEVHAAYRQLRAPATRLSSLRGLLSNHLRAYATDFMLQHNDHSVVQHYTFRIHDYRVRVELHMAVNALKFNRSIKQSQSILALNALLKDIYRDSKTYLSETRDTSYTLIHELVTRIFVLCSDDAHFECDHESSTQWSIFFDDKRAHAQADIFVERAA